MDEPKINVGVMTAPEIEFTLCGGYAGPDGEPCSSGTMTARLKNGMVEWNGKTFQELLFTPLTAQSCFELAGVTIGIGFHWERRETQRFAGALKIIPDADASGCVAVNVVGVEEYLKSVISSEMSASASEGLLRAHAIASRSWLLCQLRDRGNRRPAGSERYAVAVVDGEEVEELVRWYDREDHLQFDVCADDHCQRYQGLTRQTSPAVARAVGETAGIVLTWEGKVCDARFSKCCGGITETFGSCWGDDEPHPYLEAVADCDAAGACFCDSADAGILSRVLNGYDREDPDFSRWKVTYTAAELSRIVRERSGTDFGEVTELRPLTRGASGRITRLLVRGTRRSMVIGKELEIRRTLSASHLKSSAFDVTHDAANGTFTLSGRGWGHGVGMCQIGAAVMGERGYAGEEILRHYFPEAKLEKIY